MGKLREHDLTEMLFRDLVQENPMAPVDLTADFGNDDALIANQNRNFTMTGLTVESYPRLFHLHKQYVIGL